jgi:BatD DUF11 like domain
MRIVSNLHARYFLLFFPLLAIFPALAQVKFTTVASSNTIGRNEYVEIEFVVENAQQIDQLAQPAFNNFHLVKGPIQTSGMSVINGAVSQYKAISFVLQPTRTGTFIVPGATASIDGKSMHSNPVTIQVIAGSTGSSQLQLAPQPVWPGEPMDIDREYMIRPGENINDKIRKNLFVKVQVSKTSCYVGEPIVATYKLYSRLQSESRVSKHPSLNGFSVYDMLDPSRDASSVETINGKSFTVHIIRKAQLIPLQAGTVNLDPVEIENTVHFVKGNGQRRSNNPLQDLFDRFSEDEQTSGHVDQEVTLESKPVEISIKPLPEENRPENFNGAVGQFTMEANIDNRNVTAQDAAILKVTVKGTGNLPVVNAPSVQWPFGIESYSAGAKESIDKTVVPMNGSKTFEYKFIPDHEGTFNIPAIGFSYFDPIRAVYKTLESPAINLLVARAVKSIHRTPKPGEDTPDQLPAEENSLLKKFGYFFHDYMEWFFAMIILSAVAVYLMVQNRLHKKSEAQARLMEQEKLKAPEPVIPQDPFLLSRELLESGNYCAFYTELNRAIWKVIAEKLQLRSSEMNKHNIVQELKAKGWDEQSTKLLEDTLNECEVKLYTPAYSETDLLRIMSSAEAIVKKLEM